MGNQIITVTPVSKFQPPTSGDNRGASATVAVVVEGSAYYSGAASAPENGTTVTIASPPLQANYSSLPLARSVVGMDHGNTDVRHDRRWGRQRERRRRRHILDVDDQRPCTQHDLSRLRVRNEWLWRGSCFSRNVFTWVPPAPPPGPITFSVDADAVGSDTSKTYGLAAQPTVTQLSGYQVVYWYDGARGNGTLSLDSGAVQTITATYCLDADTARCSDPTSVAPAAGSPATTVDVSVVGTCTDTPT